MSWAACSRAQNLLQCILNITFLRRTILSTVVLGNVVGTIPLAFRRVRLEILQEALRWERNTAEQYLNDVLLLLFGSYIRMITITYVHVVLELEGVRL